jgi:heme/copper-type cytochrome/quinol oxidase subunit 2
MKIDWKRKLSSRKFWAAVIGVVISVMVMFNAPEEEQTKVTGLITACSTLIIYILAESNVDAKHALNTTPSEPHEEEEEIEINKE